MGFPPVFFRVRFNEYQLHFGVSVMKQFSLDLKYFGEYSFYVHHFSPSIFVFNKKVGFICDRQNGFTFMFELRKQLILWLEFVTIHNSSHL